MFYSIVKEVTQTNIDEFKSQMQKDLAAALEDVSPGVKIEETFVKKLQGESYEALTVQAADSRIAVSLNVTQLFDRMENGTAYDTILDETVDLASEELDHMQQVDLPDITSYENAKNHLYVEVVGVERNEETLSHIPFTQIEDLALVYRVLLDDFKEDGQASVLVNNDLMRMFGVDKDQLHADAMANAVEMRPPVMKTMAQVMADMMGITVDELPFGKDSALYVVTTEDKTKGASVMFYPDFLDSAAKELGGDFFVLPSSVHEVLLLKDDGEITLEQLSGMVQSINSTEVAPAEQLTDNVYHYDADARVFELGEKFQTRQMSDEEHEHSSVLQKLKEATVDVQKAPKPHATHKAKAEQIL